MVGVFRRKIAARADGKLHCLLGELPGALAAASTSGEHSLPQAYDLALSHMTFHHIADVAGARAGAAPSFGQVGQAAMVQSLVQSLPSCGGLLHSLPPTPPTLLPAHRRHAAHAARPAQAGRQGGGVRPAQRAGL